MCGVRGFAIGPGEQVLGSGPSFGGVFWAFGFFGEGEEVFEGQPGAGLSGLPLHAQVGDGDKCFLFTFQLCGEYGCGIQHICGLAGEDAAVVFQHYCHCSDYGHFLFSAKVTEVGLSQGGLDTFGVAVGFGGGVGQLCGPSGAGVCCGFHSSALAEQVILAFV